jgi:hypothetical protein
MFEIKLDRPSGVFYAGEVVTGSMTLQANGETCRSLMLSMIGKAKVHWHVQSGESRTDYDGRKIFLQSEQTLWGNFYRTTVLDNAGADAEFGGAMGDGDMNIPCLPNEGSEGRPMKLIVRVCDYDWGKKDDKLGEIILDGKELAMHGDSKTYNLMRKGKPEQGTVTLAAKFVPTSAITPKSHGQTAQSQETLVLKVLKANGLRKGDMFGKNDVYVQVWRAPDDLVTPLEVGKKLPKPDVKIQLPDQVTTFKFAFPTRADSPGSAVAHCGDQAYIAYYIKAEIDKKSWHNPSLKYPITIIPMRPAPMPQLLSQFKMEKEKQIKKTKFCCCSCREAGLVTVKLNSRRAYAPGETLQLTGSQVVNSSSISVTVRIVIRQTIKLATTGSREVTHYGSQRFEIGSKELDPGSSIGLDDFQAVVPALPPSFFGARGSATARREPLIFTYELSLQAEASAGTKVKVVMPILISALPPKQQAIQDANASNNNLVPIDNPFEIQSYAVTDDSPCNTVIMATGLEDGAGKIADSATGAANIYEPEDGGSSSKTYMYQPQVLTFQSTFNTIEEAIAPGDVGNNEADHATAYNALIEKMEFNTDTRLVVDRWIKEFPTAAASLSSDEFAGVLKKLMLSFEQAAVARELTSGMGNGALTTEYIMKSFDACPYSKDELVRVMAPYVSDPENKGIVLEQLYSFEREEASKMFGR